MKFYNTQSNREKSMLGSLYEQLIKYVAYDWKLLAILCILSCAAVICFLRKKNKTECDRKIGFLGSIILEEGLILLIVTKQAYFKALYPLIFLCMLYLLSELGNAAIGAKRKHQVCLTMAVLIALYSFYGISASVKDKHREGEELWEVESVLNQYKTDDLIYIRGRGSNYDFMKMLLNYENILVVTTAESTWEGYENSEELESAGELTLVICDQGGYGTDEEVLTWLRENQYILQEKLMETGAYRIYYVCRS